MQVSSEQASPNPTGDIFLKFGSLSLLVFVALVVAGIVVNNTVGPGVLSSTSAEVALQSLAQHKGVFLGTNALFHLSILFLVPFILALYQGLKPVQPGFALLGTTLVLLGLLNYIGWIFAFNVALTRLSDQYLAASTDAQRAAYVAAADFDLGAQAGGEILGGILFLPWILITSILMVRSSFPRWLGYMGIAAGVGIVFGPLGALWPAGAPVLATVGFLSLLLLLSWFLITAITLYRMAQSTQPRQNRAG